MILFILRRYIRLVQGNRFLLQNRAHQLIQRNAGEQMA